MAADLGIYALSVDGPSLYTDLIPPRLSCFARNGGAIRVWPWK
jgi:hypothetical protein